MDIKMTMLNTVGITTIEVVTMEDGSEGTEDKTNTTTGIDRIVEAIKGTVMEVEAIGAIINETIGGIIITRVIEITTAAKLTTVEGLSQKRCSTKSKSMKIQITDCTIATTRSSS